MEVKYKIRFNLSRGDHFMHWQIRNNKGDVKYFDPEKIKIKMFNCKLKNRFNIANEIFNGENKRVCAWVECDNYIISREIDNIIDEKKELRYNPRISPNWFNKFNKNIDNLVFHELITNKNKIYVG